MIRTPGWETRLAAFVEERRYAAHVWGTNDCCLFACDGVQAQVGEDPAAFFRGRYTDAAGARALLAEHADGTVLGTARRIARELGAPETDWRHLGRGDVALVDLSGRDFLALVAPSGRHILIPGETGILSYPARLATVGWRIG